MNREAQRTALAELDGWTQHTMSPDDPYTCTVCNISYSPSIWREWEPALRWCSKDGMYGPPDYLEDYDPTMRLIQKQPIEVMRKFEAIYPKLFGFDVWRLTPAQLCETLLRATGKWKEASK